MQEDALEGTADTGHKDAPVSETNMVHTFLTMSESREGLRWVLQVESPSGSSPCLSWQSNAMQVTYGAP